jgi:ribosomal protein S18 acetylase RimI-like enzyme
MDVDLRIRHAELSDAAELAALVCDLGYKTTGAEMESRLVSILKDSRDKTLVALKDKKICGMLGTFSASSYLHNDLNGRIIALVVSRESRQRGIGARLIAAAEKDFAQRGITRVTLTTRFEREEAHQFYEKVVMRGLASALQKISYPPPVKTATQPQRYRSIAHANEKKTFGGSNETSVAGMRRDKAFGQFLNV